MNRWLFVLPALFLVLTACAYNPSGADLVKDLQAGRSLVIMGVHGDIAAFSVHVAALDGRSRARDTSRSGAGYERGLIRYMELNSVQAATWNRDFIALATSPHRIFPMMPGEYFIESCQAQTRFTNGLTRHFGWYGERAPAGLVTFAVQPGEIVYVGDLGCEFQTQSVRIDRREDLARQFLATQAELPQEMNVRLARRF